MNPIKIVVSSKKNLEFKYGKKFSQINNLLQRLKASDKQKGFDTRIVFIDDAASARASGIKTVKHLTPKACKESVDALYKKHIPVYIVLLGAQDVFPFQEINNPADDEDAHVPSDLPYACDAPYSNDIANFTGPTRVVGRIPDVPGIQKDTSYLKRLIENVIRHMPADPDIYRGYFSISANVWKKSTQISLQHMFGDIRQLKLSPKEGPKFRKTQLKPLTHFINCHGAINATSFYGQRGESYPEALQSAILQDQVRYGTVVAAECCYGAALFDSSTLQLPHLSIANTYLGSDAIAFLGSSTIAYGPADSNALADLLTQYFIRNILNGMSTGRALLEARQLFLTESGPQLDPYELKTLAQFYLLGDPSVLPTKMVETNNQKKTIGGTIENNRLNLFNKGMTLKNSIMPSEKKKTKQAPADERKLREILKATRFERSDKQLLYGVNKKNTGASGMQKKITGANARFRTFIRPQKKKNIQLTRVLVIKEDNDQVLGWRVYETR